MNQTVAPCIFWFVIAKPGTIKIYSRKMLISYTVNVIFVQNTEKKSLRRYRNCDKDFFGLCSRM